MVEPSAGAVASNLVEPNPNTTLMNFSFSLGSRNDSRCMQWTKREICVYFCYSASPSANVFMIIIKNAYKQGIARIYIILHPSS